MPLIGLSPNAKRKSASQVPERNGPDFGRDLANVAAVGQLLGRCPGSRSGYPPYSERVRTTLAVGRALTLLPNSLITASSYSGKVFTASFALTCTTL